MEHKFIVGQLVKMARPRSKPEMIGAIGEVIMLPGGGDIMPDGRMLSVINQERYGLSPDHYLVHFPSCKEYSHDNSGYFQSPGKSLDPINDEDSRTVEDRSKLVFNPSKKKVTR